MTSLDTHDGTAVTLIAHDDDASERLQLFLGKAGALRRGASIREALAADPHGLVLILWRMPIDYVTRAIAAGDDGATALIDWRDATSDALAACRKGRSQVVIIDAQMLEDAPEATAQSITTRTGLAMSVPKSWTRKDSNAFGTPALDAQASEEHSGLPLIFAAALLSADPVAMELAFELEAMALRPAGRALPDAGAVAVAMARTQAAHNVARLIPVAEPTAVTANDAQLAVMLEETESVANTWARRCGELERELEALHTERVLMIESLRQALDADSPAPGGQAGGSLRPARQRPHRNMQRQREYDPAAERTMTKEILRLAALLRTGERVASITSRD